MKPPSLHQALRLSSITDASSYRCPRAAARPWLLLLVVASAPVEGRPRAPGKGTVGRTSSPSPKAPSSNSAGAVDPCVRVLQPTDTPDLATVAAAADKAATDENPQCLLAAVYRLDELRDHSGHPATDLETRVAALGRERHPLDRACFSAMRGAGRAAALSEAAFANIIEGPVPITPEGEEIVLQLGDVLLCTDPSRKIYTYLSSRLEDLALSTIDVTGSMGALHSALARRTGNGAFSCPRTTWHLTGCVLFKIARDAERSPDRVPISKQLLRVMESFWRAGGRAEPVQVRRPIALLMAQIARQLTSPDSQAPLDLEVLALLEKDLALLNEDTQLGAWIYKNRLDDDIRRRLERVAAEARGAGLGALAFASEAALVLDAGRTTCRRASNVASHFSRWSESGEPRGRWQDAAAALLDVAIDEGQRCPDGGLLVDHLGRLRTAVSKGGWPFQRHKKFQEADVVPGARAPKR
jgi:uncharacterized cupin superfamily protein